MTLEKINQRFDDLIVFMDWRITRRAWELQFNNPPTTMTFERFITEKSPHTGMTWLNEWKWKWPEGSINI